MRSPFKLGTFFALVVTAAMSSCGSDESAPASTCGNGVAEGSEGCDGADLRGATCGSLMLGSGTVSCDLASCQLVLTGCSNGVGGGGGQMNP